MYGNLRQDHLTCFWELHHKTMGTAVGLQKCTTLPKLYVHLYSLPKWGGHADISSPVELRTDKIPAGKMAEDGHEVLPSTAPLSHSPPPPPQGCKALSYLQCG